MLGEVNHTTTHIEATDWRDIPDLYAKLQDNKTTHRTLKLVILTAVRIHSARAARREEFSGDVWTIPEDRMKGREGKTEAFRVPLSTQAQELLSSWMEETDEDYLFSARKGKPLSDRSIEKALDDIEEAGRPHGLANSLSELGARYRGRIIRRSRNVTRSYHWKTKLSALMLVPICWISAAY